MDDLSLRKDSKVSQVYKKCKWMQPKAAMDIRESTRVGRREKRTYS